MEMVLLLLGFFLKGKAVVMSDSLQMLVSMAQPESLEPSLAPWTSSSQMGVGSLSAYFKRQELIDFNESKKQDYLIIIDLLSSSTYFLLTGNNDYNKLQRFWNLTH